MKSNVKNTDYGQFVTPGKTSKEISHDWEVDYEKYLAEKNLKRKKKNKREKISVSEENSEQIKTLRKEKSKQKKAPREKKLKPKSNVKYYISAKLIGIISATILISLGGITALVSYFVSADTKISAEDTNLTLNSRTASDCESRINSIISFTDMYLDLLEKTDGNEAENSQIASLFFERNDEIAAVFLPDTNRSYINTSFQTANDISSETFQSYVFMENDLVTKAYIGQTSFENASPFFNLPMLAIVYPLENRGEDTVAFVFYSSQELFDTVSTGSVNLSFIVNDKGQVLVHPDLSVILNAEDYSENPLIITMRTGSNDSEQVYFKDADDIEYIGAYKKIMNGSCGVITMVRTQIVLEAVNRTTNRNIYLTIAILSIAILIIWFFSKSISNPLKKLTAVANEINAGNFNTELFDSLSDKRKDEIGVLIQSTQNEREILNTVSSLTNKGVTDAIIKKEIDFNPHLKDITIFFSDIRGFTAISDSFNKRYGKQSAAEIINFLNDYMSRMVNCIKLSGGTVDKFEGDAIMACWGTLRDDNLDFELLPNDDPEKKRLWLEHRAHVREDALNAVRGTLAMRYALMKYNHDAETYLRKHTGEKNLSLKPHIRIGSGLNSGRATVGFMGCQDKMEFTAIGDSVNLASRTESSNKPCGTDILITEDTYNLLKRNYIRCEENNFTISKENLKNEIIVEKIPVSFEVKGKGEQHFYGVVNMPRFDITEFFKVGDPDFRLDENCMNSIGPFGPTTLNEVRTLLGIPIPDFAGVNLDEEENKIQVKSN